MTADVTVLGSFEVSLVWQFIMNRLTAEQRLHIVEIYLENNFSIRETHRAIRTFYGAHNRPSGRLIRETIDRFRNTFTLNDNTQPIKRRIMRTQ